jgi:phosphoglycolate phosphatase
VNDTDSALRGALMTANTVFFDFDGPLCNVFAGYPARQVARELQEILGINQDISDPLEVLGVSAREPPTLLREVEIALIEAEIHAVSKSEPTLGGLECLRACSERNIPVGIVSNNSTDSVMEFLDMTGTASLVDSVVGRVPFDPSQMKPHPGILQRAMKDVGAASDSSVYIGDSVTDIEVASKVDMPCLAYANKPGKHDKFLTAGATVIFDHMNQLQTAIMAKRAR